MEKKQSTHNKHHIPKSVAPLVFAFIIISSFFTALLGGISLVSFFIEAIFGVVDVKNIEVKRDLAQSLAMFIVALPIFIVSLKQFLKKY